MTTDAHTSPDDLPDDLPGEITDDMLDEVSGGTTTIDLTVT